MPLNLSTVVVLLVVAALFGLAVRSIVRQRKGGRCGGCSEKSCPGHGDGGACPSVARAMADVEAKLGKPGGTAGDR